ncbi:MAG: AbrB/MazE/SpoVT family DNA-binding domain-containing protein [Mongoliitalea sp.]
METKIRKIGNSSGVILPKALIDKYALAEVVIEDHGDGIMIRPATKSIFQLKMEEARKNKKEIYSTMEKEASDPNTRAYYKQEVEELGDIDTEIIDT